MAIISILLSFSQAYAELSKLYVDSYGKQHRFMVELAVTIPEREKGLMFRKQLENDHGMLFIFPKQKVHAMWMKNTYIPLDMLFIDQYGMIIHIFHNATPLSEKIISSTRPAKAILEVKGGTCEKLGIQIGDRVIHESITIAADR